jgi:serine/threonine-protein kinase
MSDTVVLPSSALPGHRPGDVIAGRYRLEREIGRGSMGTVWSAMHATLGQRVAIKLISSEQAGSSDARQRFALEAKAAARLRSRHVVGVYDDGETPDGTPYIVMEYLEGETLEQRLERQRDMSLGEAVRITTHVARALARAHAQGIIHRDLKSGNIFLAKTEDDEIGWVAKVLDFGVAKLADKHGPSTTKTGTIVGTPLFMSPEQIRGASHVDHRADLYSLGMVFYNMVTGSHAFDGPSYSDVLVSICTQTLPDIRVAAPWLPTAVRGWFDKACARDRELRFQSADEMAEALLEAAGPAGRNSQPIIPEEAARPSATLVGYASPESSTTILHADSAPSKTVVMSEPLAGSSGTLRSRVSTGGSETVRPRSGAARGVLAIWAAAGVALAVIAMLIATAIGRLTTERPSADAARAAQPEPPRALAEPAETALPNPPPPPKAPEATTPDPEPPATAPSPKREPLTPSEAAAGDDRAVRPRAQRSPTAAPKAALAPTQAAPPPASEPAPPAAAPDMGF